MVSMLLLSANSSRIRKAAIFFYSPTNEGREEFALLIGGIDLSAATKRKWYRRSPAEESELSTEAA